MGLDTRGIKLTARLGSYLVTRTPAYAFIAGVSAGFDKGQPVWWWASQRWAQGGCKAAGVTNIHRFGLENVLPGVSYIVMSNHESYLDPMLLIDSFSEPVSFLAKQELFHVPVFGWSLDRMGHIPVDRGNQKRAFASIDSAAERVKTGKRVVIFPEGTRNRQPGQLQSFKKGGFVLAIKSRVAILPVAIHGSGAVWPAKGMPHGKGAITMVFGTPIPVSDYQLEDKDSLMQTTHAVMEQLLIEAKNRAVSVNS